MLQPYFTLSNCCLNLLLLQNSFSWSFSETDIWKNEPRKKKKTMSINNECSLLCLVNYAIVEKIWIEYDLWLINLRKVDAHLWKLMLKVRLIFSTKASWRLGVKYFQKYLNANANTFQKYFKYFFKYFDRYAISIKNRNND